MENQKLVIGIGGNVRIGHEVDKEIAHKGYFYPWGDLLQHLKNTDLNLVNLETSLTTCHKSFVKGEVYKAALDKVAALDTANIGLVNIANAHAMDFSAEGMLETVRVLDEHRIKHAGAGKDEISAWWPAIVERKGLTLGFLGVSEAMDNWQAQQSSPGIAYVNIQDTSSRQKLFRAIEQIRSKVDLLITSICWNISPYANIPQAYVDFSHQLVDKGVDVVSGHTAHHLREIEIYNRKLILYSTGNLLSDFDERHQNNDDQSVFVTIELESSNLKKVKVQPTIINNCRVSCAQKESYSWIMKEMQSLSSRFDLVFDNNGEVLVN